MKRSNKDREDGGNQETDQEEDEEDEEEEQEQEAPKAGDSKH